MRVAIALVASFASMVASAAVPSFASAQVWREDPCRYGRTRSYEICPYRDEWRAYGDY